uniref:WASH complex subunit CCDC53 n=1 Tax=Cacopsylla melanoneura TaxID=428564 RepID=A0A8D8R5B1_9HEMI
MDLSKVPPIQQKRIVEFVNNFVISTVQFLDKFANNCEISLQRLDVKLRKVEAELCILEYKLNSVPALKTTSVPNVVAPAIPQSPDPPNPVPNPNISSSPATPTQEVAQENNPKEENPADTNSNPHDETDADNKPKEEVPEELKRFYKMIQFGVPVQAVKLKMKAEGFDPELIQS